MSGLDRIREDVQRKAAEQPAATSILDRIPILASTHGFVRDTAELRRVVALPRQHWECREDLGELVDSMTDYYKLEQGTMGLWPIQAVALETLYDFGGLFGSIAVGGGKTLISYLAAVILDVVSTVLLVPAKLREKTHRDFAELSKHWKNPGQIHVVSYEILGRAQAAEMLDELKPQLLIADECHRLKNLQAAVTRRVIRYLREHRDVHVVAMSGTVTSRSLRDFHHLLGISLGREGIPLPCYRSEVGVWARAVDEKVNTRARAGALSKLLEVGDSPSLENVRKAVGRRIYETPGVIHTSESEVSSSILLDYFSPDLCLEVQERLKILMIDQIAPNGDECLPSDIWRHTRTLVCGFYYQWDPTPPAEWLRARKAWRCFVRNILEGGDPRYDSELQVSNACARGDLHGGRAYCDWYSVRKEFKINTVPVWIDEDVLGNIADDIEWQRPTLIWVEHVATGEKLSELSNLPYFHREGKDAEDNFIDDHDPEQSAILSIASNAEGRNLQAWSRNLVVTPPASGRMWEQLLGRTHRPGQDADEVEVMVMLGHSEIRNSLQQAFNDARYIQSTTLNPQKLLLADSTEKF